MIEEIIYTSAPKGLKQGSRGFCTVVSTGGMGANMAERLESMSGYRHAFALHDPQAALNPVNYAHVTTRMAGQNLHVLSRVADAGQDYSGRTNKLAHHLVVDDVSSLTAGPARVLAAPGTLCTAWDGQLATRPPRQLQNPKLPTSINFNAWKAATGDGGWGGFVAEKLLSGRAPVSIIFPAGTETLPLVQEVLDLIPVAQRWNITFSTYFTRLLAGTECQLRFYLDGTPEATSIRNDARAIRIDLAASLPPATGGKLVEAARSGNLHVQTKDAAAEASRSATAAALAGPAGVISDDELDQMLDSERAADASLARAVRGKPAPAAPSAPHLAPTGSTTSRRASRVDAALQRPRTSTTAWVAGTFLALILIGSVATFFAVRTSSSSTANNNVASTQKSLDVVKPAPVPETQQATTEISQTAFEKSEFQQPVEEKATELEMPKPSPDPFPGKRPFDDLRRKSVRDGNAPEWILALPDEKVSGNTAFNDQVFLTLPEKIQITSSDRSLKVKSPLTSGDVTKFAVQHQDVLVGHFVFHSSSPTDPLRLTWEWSQDVVKRFGDVQSREAAAVRKFRNRLFTFEVDSVENQVHHRSDEVQITMRLSELSPFRSWPADTRSNLTHSLNVPEPGSRNADGIPLLTSETVLIETSSVENLQIKILEEYRTITREYDAYILDQGHRRRATTGTSEQRTWQLGRVPKGLDLNDRIKLAENSEPFGVLRAVQDSEKDIVKLSFEWLATAELQPQDAQLVLWAPLVVTASGNPRLLFLRGPVRMDRMSMQDLLQQGKLDYPDQISRRLPFRESPSTTTSFEISLNHHGNLSTHQLNATPAAALPSQTLAWFDLADPLKLQDQKIEMRAGQLGIGRLVATVKPSTDGAVSTALEWKLTGEFNRLNAETCEEYAFVDPSRREFWEVPEDGKPIRFKLADYVKEGDALVKTLSKIATLAPEGKRLELDNLTKTNVLGDRLKAADDSLEINHIRGKRLIPSERYVPEDLDIWFFKFTAGRDTFLASMRNDVSPAKNQAEAFDKLRNLYTKEQQRMISSTVEGLCDQFADLQIGVSIALEIPTKQAGVIRLYIASTSDEVTE